MKSVLTATVLTATLMAAGFASASTGLHRGAQSASAAEKSFTTYRNSAPDYALTGQTQDRYAGDATRKLYTGQRHQSVIVPGGRNTQ